MLMNHFLLAGGWMLYGFLHSWLASAGFKKTMMKTMGRQFRYYRLFYTVFAFLTLIAILWLMLNTTSFLLFQPGMLSNLAALILFTLGIIIMIICIRKYFMSLSGVRSLAVEEEDKQPLMTGGLHRYVRHPLYLGTFLVIWALFLFKPLLSYFITNLVITIYTLVGIRLEEKKLVEIFGERYRLYRQKVPMLLPLDLFKRNSRAELTEN